MDIKLDYVIFHVIMHLLDKVEHCRTLMDVVLKMVPAVFLLYSMFKQLTDLETKCYARLAMCLRQR